jgi:hypothetical protein
MGMMASVIGSQKRQPSIMAPPSDAIFERAQRIVGLEMLEIEPTDRWGAS